MRIRIPAAHHTKHIHTPPSFASALRHPRRSFANGNLILSFPLHWPWAASPLLSSHCLPAPDTYPPAGWWNLPGAPGHPLRFVLTTAAASRSIFHTSAKLWCPVLLTAIPVPHRIPSSFSIRTHIYPTKAPQGYANTQSNRSISAHLHHCSPSPFSTVPVPKYEVFIRLARSPDRLPSPLGMIWYLLLPLRGYVIFSLPVADIQVSPCLNPPS